jgi:hydrogenase expression/formation protein HypE
MNQSTIKLAHGSGGILSFELVESLFLKYFTNPHLAKLEDSAVITNSTNQIAVTTDSFVIDPLFFPGGDIGKLAISGTVNDLVVRGAIPKFITAGFIIQEGFSLQILENIVISMAETMRLANIEIISGDTKVVPKGAVDKLFINTTGIGWFEHSVYSIYNVRPGDHIVITGGLGEHEVSVLLARQDLGIETRVESDVNPLNGLLSPLLGQDMGVHAMRDPTRGGMAAVLNEIALAADVEIEIDEKELPVKPSVQNICELLGYDVLTLANEGKAVIFCNEDRVDDILTVLQQHPLGREARWIGQVRTGPARVLLKTCIGGKRIVDMPLGVPLPRIC